MFPFFLFLNRSFSFLRHCCVFVFRSRFPLYFVNSFHFVFSLCHSFLSYVSSLISLSSKSFLIFLTSLLCISLSLSSSHCISSILSDFVCFVCRSLSFLLQFFNFFAFASRSFSYLRHCCIFVFGCPSFSFLRHCCLIVFRLSSVFCQFSPTLFAFICRSFLSYVSFFNFFVFLSR